MGLESKIPPSDRLTDQRGGARLAMPAPRCIDRDRWPGGYAPFPGLL